MKAFWTAYKIPIIIVAAIIGLALIISYQWGYINGENHINKK